MERRFAAVFLKPLDHDALVRHVGELLDVEWRWSSDPGVEHRVVQSAEAPEQRDLDELAAMVRLGEVTAINEWARCLRSRRPDKAAFADRVAEAAESLDFPQLEKLAGGSVR
jgi:hypothetical protein